ncbi:TetR/AcrR family transcriptional regulator [Shimia sp.]|jgi:AcrR family transcriptional regulator|uniref:TetR/AcrR family transcriptional regulator n=1 Tax=unclassified Shimia TaxID=2630038 RepID=UPI0025E7DEDD|nr:TetR/AcrR family transcriptional regulator [Shimia sp.]MCH2068897.1 TetR/AcrR family transcriptional regulator [Shimia sp.]
MAGKVAERRAALRIKLIELAEEQIAAGGLSSLKARELAKGAGCAVGAIYNVFDDLHDLVLEVNGRTFKKLGAAVSASYDGSESPRQRLILMSNAYLEFAAAHPKLWRALFDVEMTEDGAVPEWYLSSLGALFANIRAPLSELYSEMGEEELGLMTRAMFSAVHGIVLLGLENRISGVPPEHIRTMIAQVLSRIGPEVVMEK